MSLCICFTVYCALVVEALVNVLKYLLLKCGEGGFEALLVLWQNYSRLFTSGMYSAHLV